MDKPILNYLIAQKAKLIEDLIPNEPLIHEPYDLVQSLDQQYRLLLASASCFLANPFSETLRKHFSIFEFAVKMSYLLELHDIFRLLYVQVSLPFPELLFDSFFSSSTILSCN